jgi:hypothetical protein
MGVEGELGPRFPPYFRFRKFGESLAIFAK